MREQLCTPKKERKHIIYYSQAGQKQLKIEEAFRNELEFWYSIHTREHYSSRENLAL